MIRYKMIDIYLYMFIDIDLLQRPVRLFTACLLSLVLLYGALRWSLPWTCLLVYLLAGRGGVVSCLFSLVCWGAVGQKWGSGNREKWSSGMGVLQN